ncbi:MAG: ribosome-binding factor A [Chloroflexi bacterium RBG_19FT_COMBO_62_14]|nr:MAG: ribosome-binding factor A [Chloroflexi bacterium RBG_19FT_COMBO_62_14]
MVSDARAQRIGERIQRELADVFLKEIGDPRLSMVTVTGVEVDRELAYATVYVSSIEADQRREEILKALGRAKGRLRSELAGRIELRAFPKLRFQFDSSPDRGARIEALLEQLRQEGEGGKRRTSEE